jgi:hypothetical protein
MEYQVVTGCGCDDLAEKVNEALEEGWLPLQGMCNIDRHNAEHSNPTLGQPMVKGSWFELRRIP